MPQSSDTNIWIFFSAVYVFIFLLSFVGAEITGYELNQANSWFARLITNLIVIIYFPIFMLQYFGMATDIPESVDLIIFFILPIVDGFIFVFVLVKAYNFLSMKRYMEKLGEDIEEKRDL